MEILLETLLTLVFAIHLLSVNIGMGAPLVCIGLHGRAGRCKESCVDQAGLRLARGSIALTALGILSGGILLGILWLQGETSYFDALSQFTARKYWFTLGELVFYFVCMFAYVSLWNRCQSTKTKRVLHALLAVLAATNLLYHFPTMMAVLATIPTREDWMGKVVDAAQFQKMVFFDPEIISRVLHVWLSSIAVSGVALMALSLRPMREQGSRQASRLAVLGARIALVPTLLQILVGVWVLLSVPRGAQSALMGGDLLGTGLLAISVMMALGLMHYLATVALGDTNPKTIVRSIIILFLVVLCMSGVLRRVRNESRSVTQGSVSQRMVSQRMVFQRSGVYENSRVDCSTRLCGFRSQNECG